MRMRPAVSVVLVLLVSTALVGQTTQAGVLKAAELKAAVPASFFFHGQSAPTQLRNSVGIRNADGKMMIAGLVDTAGYASNITEKYQGFLITETKIEVEGTTLGPGAYGMAFSKDGKFVVMDVGGNELLSVAAKTDSKLAHPVPLKVTQADGDYQLYAGSHWVGIHLP